MSGLACYYADLAGKRPDIRGRKAGSSIGKKKLIRDPAHDTAWVAGSLPRQSGLNPIASNSVLKSCPWRLNHKPAKRYSPPDRFQTQHARVSGPPQIHGKAGHSHHQRQGGNRRPGCQVVSASPRPSRTSRNHRSGQGGHRLGQPRRRPFQRRTFRRHRAATSDQDQRMIFRVIIQPAAERGIRQQVEWIAEGDILVFVKCPCLAGLLKRQEGEIWRSTQ